jgi:peptidoglycan/xylan/chitin deacetylase (PgdA/CDA1 family)
MQRVAVLTFDEPEFEPSYVGTVNEGKSVFAWVFFTGRCKFSQIDFRIFEHRSVIKGLIYLVAAFYYSTRSLFFRSQTVFDNLRRNDVRATFYGIFELLDDPVDRQQYLSIYRNILSHGHELGLHGYRHLPLTEDDLMRSRALAREHLGAELTTYSSPIGDDRVETLALLEKHGFLGMRVWDRSFLDMTSPVRRYAYDYTLDTILSSEAPVVVINLHSTDYYPWGVRRVTRAITALRKKGYEFTTFRELCAPVKTG